MVITDFEEALRNVLQRVWSDVRRQLCIFHVNKNVVTNINKK